MKILYDPLIFELQVFGGISLYHCKLMEYFHNDSEVNPVLPLYYSDNRYLCDLDFIKYKSFYTKAVPFKNRLSKYLSKINKLKTINELNRQDFDVYHPSYFDNYFLKNLKKKPYVLTVHDMTAEILPEQFFFDKYHRETIELKKQLIKNATKIIAISENTKNDIINLYNINEDKIYLIHHGCSIQPDIEENIDLKNELPEKYILFVGNRAKYKNFVSFLQAIAPILKENRNLYVLSAGGPNFNKTEREILCSLDIEKQIRRMPLSFDSDLVTYYKNALCFVFPSLYEGFGFPILEAYQYGCPVICSNTSSFPEIAGNAAVLVDPYDELSIKQGVEKVLFNEELRKELARKGYEQVKKFDWQITAEKTKEIYKTVL